MKRDMRKHPGRFHRRRLEIDWLEGRRLLTGLSSGLAAGASSPALLAPTRRQIAPADEPHTLLALSPAVRPDLEPGSTGSEVFSSHPTGAVKLQATTATGRASGPFVVARKSDPEQDDRTEALTLAGPAPRPETWPFSTSRYYERPAAGLPAVHRMRRALAPADSAPRALDGRSPQPDEAAPAVGSLAASRRVLDGLAAPRPRGFGLIDRVLPFSEGSLTRAVDRIFDQVERLGTPAALRPRGSAKFVPPLALALAGAGLEVARRRLRDAVDDDHEERSRGPYGTISRHDLPGMPRS
jgi:hypothetical protein